MMWPGSKPEPELEIRVQLGQLEFHACGSEAAVREELGRFHEWCRKILHDGLAVQAMMQRPGTAHS